MAKQTKATKTSEVPSSTSTVPSAPIIQLTTVVPETVQTVAPVVKKVKAVKQTLATPTPAPTPTVGATTDVSASAPSVASVAVVASVPAVVQLVAVEEPAEFDNSLVEKSADYVTKLQQLTALVNSMKSDYKALEKQFIRDLKVATKQSLKKKKRLGSRAPSGFVKPTRISDELAQFLEQPLGSEMARTEVTKNINQYIRLNNLQDKSNGRRIIPDAKLSVLLKIQSGQELTYFNLQRFMSCHFPKSKVASASASASV